MHSSKKPSFMLSEAKIFFKSRRPKLDRSLRHERIGRCTRPVLQTHASSQASQHILASWRSVVREKFDKAAYVFENGNRMESLKIYEQALKSQELSLKERQEALYGATVVHASFGDVEQAQVSLREGLACGLDFEAALKDETLLKWKSGPQVLVQLKKFAKALTSIKKAVAKPSGPARTGFESDQRGRLDLSESLKTDFTGIDTTVGGIVKRVSLLILIGIGAGTALFFIGLELSGISR